MAAAVRDEGCSSISGPRAEFTRMALSFICARRAASMTWVVDVVQRQMQAHDVGRAQQLLEGRDAPAGHGRLAAPGKEGAVLS